MLEFVRYRDGTELPSNLFPSISDHLRSLRSLAQRQPPPESVRAVISMFPTRATAKTPAVLRFYSFNRTRSIYASLRAMEGMLCDFYLRSEIMPMVTPLPAAFLYHPEQLPEGVVNALRQRGAVIYASEE